jgi:putative peptidoglycan lipid II flippase
VLGRRLGGLPLRAWARDSLLLLLAALAAASGAWALASWLAWPAGVLGLVLQLAVSGLAGTAIYGLLAGAAGVPEARQLLLRLSRPRL